MRCGLLSNAVPTSAGYELHFAAGLGRLSLISSATAVKKAANCFGVPSLKAINRPTAIAITAIFQTLIKVFPKEKHRSVGKDYG